MRCHVRWSPLLIASLLLVSACSDDSTPTPTPEPERPDLSRFAAIGTSISMGWASDGAVAASQEQSWPLQLARRAGHTMTAPLIGATGCRPPMQAPLASFRRISGELLTVPNASLPCAPTVAGVILPVANTAINAARAFDARNSTPENVTDPAARALYARVLPPQTTQLLAVTQQRPKFVSVELGANEVLGARDGRVLPGVTVVPVQAFATDYDAILARIGETVTTGAVLVGLISDARSFPAFRSGNELWLNRAEFLAGFNVAIQADCANSPNFIVVPFRVPAAVAAGVTRAQNGLPPEPFSCAAGSPTTVDFVLDPAEITQLNDIIRAIDAHITTQATARGWALFRLDALFGRADLKEPFSVARLMTSATPYGPLMSLDGFHPSAQGQTVLADAAARAINEKYGTSLPTGATATRAP